MPPPVPDAALPDSVLLVSVCCHRCRWQRLEYRRTSEMMLSDTVSVPLLRCRRRQRRRWRWHR